MSEHVAIRSKALHWLKNTFARRVTKVASVIAVAALIGVGITANMQVAEAAVDGYGYRGGGSGNGAGWMGSVVMADGTHGFCIDPVGLFPSGTTSRVGYVSSVAGTTSATWPNHNDTRALDANALQHINYVLNKYVPLMDTNNEGAAIAAYIYTWSVAGNTGFDYFNVRIPSGQRAAVQALLNAIIADANANYNIPQTGTASVSVNMSDAYNGTVTASISPANYTGTVVLTGATFANGSTSASITNGQTLPIIGNPLDSDTDKYHITADLSFQLPGAYGPEVMLWNTASPQYAQRDISAGRVGAPITINAAGDVADPDILFSPVVETTVASKFVAEGDQFIDTITASVAAGTPDWRQYESGAYIGVEATGTLYGPFDEQPTQAVTAPVGAPIVGTDTITLNGPGDYQSTGSLVAPEPGYYTWVWSIDFADQDAFAQATMVVDYTFTDEFGQVAETHIVPGDVIAVTNVNAARVGVGEELWDTLTVSSPTDTWLIADGALVPVTFTGTAYWMAGAYGNTDSIPSPSSTVPPEATILGVRTVVATAPGDYSTEADPIIAPLTNGYVVWVWRIIQANQPIAAQGYIKDWSDQFGVFAEVTVVEIPQVATQAVPEIGYGDEAYDVAIVNGFVPAGAYLSFSAYRQLQVGDPMLGDNGEPLLDANGDPLLATEADIDPLPVCTTDTLIYESSVVPPTGTTGDPVVPNPLDPATPLTAGANVDQEYESPRFEPLLLGDIHWVESLYTESGVLLSTGVCGVEGETTRVSQPTVRTEASSLISVGGTAHDTAYVNGFAPINATLVFKAYKHVDGLADDERGTVVCDTSANPVAVTAGENTEAQYNSPDCTFPEIGTYYWVEQLLGADGRILHEGEYGTTLEITIVEAPLAQTGAGDDHKLAAQLGAITAGGTVLGALLLTWVVRRRRNNALGY